MHDVFGLDSEGVVVAQPGVNALAGIRICHLDVDRHVGRIDEVELT
jgi:hypothetical protein